MSPGGGGRRWVSSFLMGFIGFGIGVPMLAIELASQAGATPGQNALEVSNHVARGIKVLQVTELQPRVSRVAYLGDSTVAAYDRGHTLPNYLERELSHAPAPARGQPDVTKVISLAFPAMGAISYYFLSDVIVSGKPDLIVWETSFTHVSRRWRRSNARAALAGWMELARFPEAMTLPINYVGLTIDDLILYKSVVGLGGSEAWMRLRDEQSRIDKLKELLEEWLGGAVSHRPERRFLMRAAYNSAKASLRPNWKAERYNERLEREHYGDALSGLDPEHPALQMLGGAVANFHRAGIPVLVYLNPINMDNLADLGLVDEDEIARSVQAYRSVVEENSGSFLDLHALLPDEYFRDAPGHFERDGAINGPAKLAAELAPRVREQLAQAAR